MSSRCRRRRCQHHQHGTASFNGFCEFLYLPGCRSLARSLAGCLSSSPPPPFPLTQLPEQTIELLYLGDPSKCLVPSSRKTGFNDRSSPSGRSIEKENYSVTTRVPLEGRCGAERDAAVAGSVAAHPYSRFCPSFPTPLVKTIAPSVRFPPKSDHLNEESLAHQVVCFLRCLTLLFRPAAVAAAWLAVGQVGG